MSSSPFKSDSLRLVMFDLDGTLVDSVPSLALAINQMLDGLGRPGFAVERVRDWVGNGSLMLVKRALSGNMTPNPKLSDMLVREAHLGFLAAYSALTVEGTLVYPGVKDCVAALHDQGLQLAVVTNKPARFVPEILQGFALGDYFKILVGGDSCDKQKPAPDQLYLAMEQAGVVAEQAIMVGDSANDILAAKAAGVKNIAVTYGYNHGQPVTDFAPDWVVDSLTQLL